MIDVSFIRPILGGSLRIEDKKNLTWDRNYRTMKHAKVNNIKNNNIL